MEVTRRSLKFIYFSFNHLTYYEKSTFVFTSLQTSEIYYEKHNWMKMGMGKQIQEEFLPCFHHYFYIHFKRICIFQFSQNRPKQCRLDITSKSKCVLI